MLNLISIATLLSAFSLTTFVLATPPTSPQNNLFERQASECVAATGGIACPGGQYCCPMLWECKANEPSLCTASLGPGQTITVSAIDWGAAMASVSKDVDSIRSRISGIGASVTGGVGTSVSPGRVTATSSLVQTSSAAGAEGPGSSASAPTGASSLATPAIQSPPSTATATVATPSATGGAVVPALRKDLVVGGVIGLGLFLV